MPVTWEDLSPNDRSGMTSWIWRFMNMEGEEAAATLAGDWSHCCEGVAAQMSEVLRSEFRPVSLAFDQTEPSWNRSYLVLCSKNEQTALMLQDPLADWQLQPVLDVFGRNSVSDLFKNFSMNICHPKCVNPTFDALKLDPYAATQGDLHRGLGEWGDSEQKCYGDWLGSFFLYHPGNGDGYYLRRDGRIGFWCHEVSNVPIEVRFDSLEEFMRKFVGYILGERSDFCEFQRPVDGGSPS
ncbi:MAG: hypothetical protein KDB14_19380 [Planctomycetales bacterium]|nr:hypothetical protein [Planctomycetales bacterium]